MTLATVEAITEQLTFSEEKLSLHSDNLTRMLKRYTIEEAGKEYDIALQRVTVSENVSKEGSGLKERIGA